MYDEKCLPKLIIPKHVKHEIEYLNSKNKNREWSGILFYTIEAGDITAVKDLVMRAQGIFLKDIGTAGSTSYEFSEDVVSYMDMKAEELGVEPMEIYTNWKVGHHHSHHNMGVTPSNTDNEEVEDNIKNHVGYLTTISNNSLDLSVRFSIYARIESESAYTIKDYTSQEHKVVNKGEFDGILKYKGEVEWEEEASVSDSFIKRFEELENSNKTATTWKGGQYNGGYRYYSQMSMFDERESDFKSFKKQLLSEQDDDMTVLDLDSLMLIDLITYKVDPDSVMEINTVTQALFIADRQLTTPYARITYLNGLEDMVDKTIVQYNMESVSQEEHDTQIKDMMDLLEDETHDLAKSIRERLKRKLFIQINMKS